MIRESRYDEHRKLMSISYGFVAYCQRRQGARVCGPALVIGELSDVHVAMMRFFADDRLDITGDLLPIFQQLGNQGEYHIRSISTVKWDESDDEFIVKMAWEELEEAGSTWESVSRVFSDAPVVPREELKALQMKAEQNWAFV